jgi:acyl dehydratase
MNDFWSTAVGRYAERSARLGTDAQAAYAALSGDTAADPIPEPLVTVLFSGLLGHELPGPGSIYVRQTFEFPSPMYLGETVTARVEIIAVQPDKARVTLRTTASIDSRLVCDGEALVLARQHPIR